VYRPHCAYVIKAPCYGSYIHAMYQNLLNIGKSTYVYAPLAHKLTEAQ